MNMVTKVLLGIVAALVLLFVALIVAVTVVFEPNDYRPYLVDAVEDATGRDFVLDGDLSLELFPCCGVTLGEARLGNPDGFPPEPFAAVDSAVLSVRILPLVLRREVEVGTVVLEGLSVGLLELEDGRNNWTFAGGDAAGEPADGSAPGSLRIDGLEIRNAGITYVDRSGAAWSASDILLETGAIGSEAPVPVSLALAVQDESNGTAAVAELTADLTLAGTTVRLDSSRLSATATGAAIPTGEATAKVEATSLVFDNAAGSGSLSGLDAEVQLSGARLQVTGEAAFENSVATGSGDFSLPEADLRALLAALPDLGYEPSGPDAFARLAGSGAWRLDPSSAGLSDLRITLDESTLTGSLEVTNLESGAAIVDLELDRLDVDAYLPREQRSAGTASAQAEPAAAPLDVLRDRVVDARVRIGQLRVGGVEVSSLAATLDSDGRAISLSAEAGLFGGRMRLTGSGSSAGADPAVAGRLEVDAISPRAALASLGEAPKTADPDALRALSGGADWRLGNRSLQLSAMRWQLDSTRLTGDLGIDDFARAKVRFALALDQIDLDRYLAPGDEDAGPATESGEFAVPVDLIRSLNLDGQLTAGALSVASVNVEKLDARVSAADGVLRLAPLNATLYGGTYRGSVVIDATGAQPRLTLDQTLDAVQVGGLLAGFVGSDRLDGALSLSLKGSGVGTTQTEILKGLGGDFAFNLSEGAYRGMDLGWEIRNAQALFNRADPPEQPNRGETPIRALAFAGRMVDGVLGSDKLTAEISNLKLGGRGGVNLVERTLDYKLDAEVLQSGEAGTSGLAALVGSVIPVTITGPMSKPDVKVDFEGLVVKNLQNRARNLLFERLGIQPASPPATPTAPAPDSSEPAPPAQEEREVTPEDLFRSILGEALRGKDDPD